MSEFRHPSQATNTISPTTSKPNAIDLISDYLNAKLREIKVFEGTSLGEEARQELKNYVKTLQKDETTLQILKSHDQELSKTLHQFLHEQEKIHMQRKEKGREM